MLSAWARPDGAPGCHLSDERAAITRVRSTPVDLMSAILNSGAPPSFSVASRLLTVIAAMRPRS